MLGGRFFALVFLVSACGEAADANPGVDESSVAAATTEPTVETASSSGEAFAPSVILAVPGHAAAVRPDVVVKLLFSVPMDTEVASAAFSVVDARGEVVAGAVAWDATEMVLAFRPEELLAAGSYRARVERAACTTDGIELAEPFVTDFLVYEPSGQNDKPYAG